MCCFLSSLWLLGPRFAFLIYWLIPWGRLKVTAVFGGSWFWALLGLIFLPWTTLMFTLVYPVIGLDWLWLGLAVLADFSAYAAGAARRRDASFYRGLSLKDEGSMMIHAPPSCTICRMMARQ